MSNAKDRIKQIASPEPSSWLDEAKDRRQNLTWRKYSFQIAANILLEIRKQKPINGMTQKLLAEKMGVAPQYINKVLKGKENLTLETISKFEKILNISIIDIHKPNVQEKDKSFYTINEYSFVFSPPVISGTEAPKSIEQQPKENIQFEIDKVVKNISGSLKHMSDPDKNVFIERMLNLLNQSSTNKEQSMILKNEIEKYTMYLSEPNVKYWSKYRVKNRSEKGRYENEG